jgi:predicted HTH domain antitoxin
LGGIIMLKEMPQFTVSLPDELKPFVNKLSAGDNLDDKVKVSVVIGLFTGSLITLERAAELSNLSLSDFIDLLQSQGIPWMHYTEEEKRQDDRAIKKMMFEQEN